ncbi:ABC transporter substrate-binding protein [Blautia liquoris]|uniref:ABC transporter substrate-binding protein n=1 Tax=Blautia liquoris TaxID=2779518 RepID=A0A7M2RDR6_9FIRM|nr:ABC transporter substrate-binding protein [Blautia liquoris]QOV18436.1 ABC transporter substrate-binding protein [Blautia liquoris]
MKKKSTLLSLILVFSMVVSAMGCGNKNTSVSESSTSAKSESVPSKSSSVSSDSAKDEQVKFTDSTGREVEIPKNIDRIAPSGPLAQVVLYTLCPDKLVGLAAEMKDSQTEFIDEKYRSLPVFGNFYGDTLNMEAIMSAKPQVVIDIGEMKPTAKEDMKGVQDKTGIPSIFIHMELDSMAEAYRTLGKIVGEEDQAEKIASYVEKTLSEAKEKSESIPDDKKVRIYCGSGDAGLTALIKGTVHSDIIDAAGGENVADVEQSARGGVSDISMEQLMLWQPDVILFTPGSIYSDVDMREEWQGLEAVKDKKVYEVPANPYSWIGQPPSVNRIIGIKWLGNLIYPDVFQYDMKEETKEFYKLFYHCEVTDEQVDQLLANSTKKQ